MKSEQVWQIKLRSLVTHMTTVKGESEEDGVSCPDRLYCGLLDGSMAIIEVTRSFLFLFFS